MKKSEKKSKKIIHVISLIGFVICTLLLLYPLISDKWNRYRDEQIIESYIEEIDNGDPLMYENELEKARKYNELLYSQGRNIVTDAEYNPDDYYESLLNVTGTGIMCYIEIPRIGVIEPVYHYSTDIALMQGVGHIHGSSLPTGGNNTHSVLTGHRGLPSQKIFSDLDRVKKGDNFYIHVLGHTFAYCVYSITIITPEDVSGLMIDSNMDKVTLVTCEPYGVNTHRLLVTGERIEFDESKVENGLVTTEEHGKIIDPAFIIFIGFMSFIVVSVIIVAIRNLLQKRRSSKVPIPDEQKSDVPVQKMPSRVSTPLLEYAENKYVSKEKDRRKRKDRVSLSERFENIFKNVSKEKAKRPAKERMPLSERFENRTPLFGKNTKLVKDKKPLFAGLKDNKKKISNDSKKQSRKKQTAIYKTANREKAVQSTVIESVYLVEEKPQRKHGAFYYIMVGMAISSAIVGVVVVVYKIIKKKKKNSDNE